MRLFVTKLIAFTGVYSILIGFFILTTESTFSFRERCASLVNDPLLLTGILFLLLMTQTCTWFILQLKYDAKKGKYFLKGY